MSYGAKKTVWILGAGFSRPLGGPLLYDLLSHKGRMQARARFGDAFAHDTAIVYTVFEDGHRTDSQLWQHAEEFLEVVDLARDRDPAEMSDHRTATSRLLLEMIHKRDGTMTIRRFRDLTLKTIAAECSFDRWIDPNAEAWDPYLEWAEMLNEKDTVITFNYDTVIERLPLQLGSSGRTTGLGQDSLMRPGDGACISNMTAVLKLHGSLQWGVSTTGSENNPYTFGDGYWDDFSTTGEYEPLIGMPGSTKSLFRKKHFNKIWGHAKRRIAEEADVIVFFGYRFPPSDAQSRSEILAAIKKNRANYLRIHIVLGPDVNHPDTLRLAKMLEVTLQGAGRIPVEELAHTSSAGPKPAHYVVIKQPLYVQDFMTILDERFLNGTH